MSYCTDCIHYKVCGNEGVDDSAMTFCADKKTSGDLMTDLLETVLIALACPLILPIIIETDKGEKEIRNENGRSL